jgi:outer membrane lipoprotein-sorting protein
MRAVIRFGLPALFLNAALAQTQPSVVEILKKVSETYKAISQYEFEIDTATNDNGTRAISHVHFAFKGPNKYRVEGAIPGMNVQDSNFGEGVVIHDGSTVWFYFPTPNQYASFPASALTADAPGDLGDLRPEAMDHFLTWRYRGAADLTGGAKFLREEFIEVARAKVACYVVIVSPERRGPAYTWWVDKRSYRILREDDAENSAVFTSIRLNQPIRDELFKFEPPPGARKLQTQQ